jgi:plasmid stabilization system protein ParE
MKAPYRLLWLAVLIAGCSRETSDRSPKKGDSPPDAEAAVRAQFAEVQAAIGSKDADKLWGLLSSKSRDDAEKQAKSIRAAYEKGSPAARADLEKKLALTGAELAKLTGAGVLKTKVFRDKREEVADGKVTRVTVEENSATVYFDEPDGDHEKLVFLREEGQWRAWLKIPKVK